MKKRFDDTACCEANSISSRVLLSLITLLMQVSLGSFFMLVIGDFFNLFGLEFSNWVFALLTLMPALCALLFCIIFILKESIPLDTFYDIKTSPKAQSAVSMALFVFLMGVVFFFYLKDVHVVLRIWTEVLSLGVGFVAIYSQVKLYRMKHCPAWDRRVTNEKFFASSYIGFFLFSLFVLIFSMDYVFVVLVFSTMVGALAQMFFSLEDYHELQTAQKGSMYLKETFQIYEKKFRLVKIFRFITLFLGGIAGPLYILYMKTSELLFESASFIVIALVLVFISELSDRFMFYTTIVPSSPQAS